MSYGLIKLAELNSIRQKQQRGLIKSSALNADVNLFPHQQRVVDKDGDSILIAHGVGSGKTLSGIARFERLKSDGKAKKALVVVPAGLRDNFGGSGVGKFTNSKFQIIGNKQEQQKKIYGGIDSGADYNILSYEMFRQDPDRYLTESGADTLILDEFHRGKNEGTKLTESLKAIKSDVRNVIGLTGSVVSNSLSDIQPLVDVVAAGEHRLGETKKEFDKNFLRRSNASEYKGIHESRKPIIGFSKERLLREELNKYVDYVDYDDVKETARMPNKAVEVIRVPLSEDQAKDYRLLIKNNPAMRKLVTNKRLETLKDEEAAKAFSSLIESRKLMNSAATTRSGMGLAESVRLSTKTDRLLNDLEAHLQTTEDGQAILFSHLINGGHDVLEEGLKQRGLEYGRFLGKGNSGITEEGRQRDILDFNDRKKRVMLVSAAGGEGLSLNDTTWEGVLDPHYNPEKMNQMEARGVRSGGLAHRNQEDREVDINRYLATMPKNLGIFKSKLQTPDEVIYGIAQNKDRQNQLLFNMLKEETKKRSE